jgi:hypothetical protein
MTRKKSPQAPKGKWRYGCVKRTYVTKLPKETFRESSFELVEVFDQGRSWTAEAVSMAADSRAGLILALEIAVKDLKKYDVIVEKKPIVHDMGRKK